MKKILICCSVRHRELIARIMADLEALGMTPLFPNLDLEAGNREQAVDAADKLRLIKDHLNAAEIADAAYFVLPEGRMGTGVTLELGYVLAQKIPVYFSSLTGDDTLDGWATALVPTDSLELLR